MSEELRPNYYKVPVKVTSEGGTKFTAQLECFDLTDALGLGFYGGNLLKYLFRCGKKENATIKEDRQKVITYANHLHRDGSE